MSSSLIYQALVSGIILGALYGLIGCSLTLLYGAMRIVNFAHGEFVIAGCYLAMILLDWLGLRLYVALPAAFLVFAVAGWVLYYVLIPRLSRAEDPELASFLSMYGVSLMGAATLMYFFGADTRTLNTGFEPAFFRYAGVVLPTSRLVALGCGAAIIAALFWFLYATIHGKALRAAVMNRDAVQIVGVDIEKLSAAAFGLAIGLAGVTGVLIALVFPAFGPFSGVDLTLIGFVVIVLGGLGNPVGAIAGGLIYGLVEQMSGLFLEQSMAPVVGFIVLILVIFIRPNGLFGVTQRR